MTAQSIPMNDEELRRYDLRVAMFKRRGASSEQAEQVATTCLERERDIGWRDMHSCLECKHYQHGDRCAVQPCGALQKTLFHRCHRFEWQVPKQEKQA